MSEPALLSVNFLPAFDDIVNGCEHDKKGDHGRGGVRCFVNFGNDRLTLSLEWLMPIYLPETPEMRGRRVEKDGDWLGVLDSHSATPKYGGHEANSPGYCKWVEPCYFDAGYSEGSRLIGVLVRRGLDAVVDELRKVWTEMEERP